MKTLVVGYGNPLRSDDGVGPFLANEIGGLAMEDVTVKTCHQLNVELVEGPTGKRPDDVLAAEEE